MAITHPQAVRFSNAYARVFADSLVTAYDTAAAYKAAWDANAVELGALIPDSAAEVVADGAAQDGRPPMTGQKINGLVAQATTLIAWGDALIGGKSRISILRTIAVNGRSVV